MGTTHLVSAFAALAASAVPQREIGYAADPLGCSLYFGRSIAIDGAVLAVGLIDPTNSVGGVRIYERAGNAWATQQTIVPFALPAMSNGRMVAASGGRVFVSSNYAGVFGNQLVYGLVTVWERSAGQWVVADTFAPTQISAPDFFPVRFDVDGTMAVGTTLANGDPVFVFERVDPITGWVEVAQLQDAVTPWVRAVDVAVSGNRIAVVATVPGQCPLCTTALYVFDRGPTGTWAQSASIPSPGWSGWVRLEQDRLAWIEATGFLSATYSLTIGDRDPASGVWNTTPLGPIAGGGGFYGSMALAGDLVLVADGTTDSLAVPNLVQLHRYDGTSWSRELWRERNGFGRLVDTDGVVAAVLSGPWGPFGTGTCIEPGRVNVYDLNLPADIGAVSTPTIGGCPGAPVLSSNAPVLGTVVSSTATLWPADAAAAFYCLGLSDTALGGVPLPLALDALGFTGCSLGQDCAIGLAFPAVLTGTTVTCSLSLPLDLSLVGLHVYQQAWVVAGSANGGALLSNAIDLRLGAHR